MHVAVCHDWISVFQNLYWVLVHLSHNKSAIDDGLRCMIEDLYFSCDGTMLSGVLAWVYQFIFFHVNQLYAGVLRYQGTLSCCFMI